MSGFSLDVAITFLYIYIYIYTLLCGADDATINSLGVDPCIFEGVVPSLTYGPLPCESLFSHYHSHLSTLLDIDQLCCFCCPLCGLFVVCFIVCNEPLLFATLPTLKTSVPDTCYRYLLRYIIKLPIYYSWLNAYFSIP